MPHSRVFCSCNEGDYDYGSTQHDGNAVARRASIQRDANSLRTQAAADLRSELGVTETNFSRTADAQTTARLAAAKVYGH